MANADVGAARVPPLWRGRISRVLTGFLPFGFLPWAEASPGAIAPRRTTRTRASSGDAFGNGMARGRRTSRVSEAMGASWPAALRGLLLLALGLAAVLALQGCAAPSPPPPTRTLTLQLAPEGRTVTVDVHAPAGQVRGAAVLSHGFTRSRTTMAGHAHALATDGVLALTVDLPYTFDFERNALALGDLVGRLRRTETFGTPVDRVILIGFSAGGLSSLLAAHTEGVAGYVGLDPFDRLHRDRGGALGLEAAPQVRVPTLLLRAPPSSCNAQSVAAPWAGALSGLESDEIIAGASHCDFESPTDRVCQWACGGADPMRQRLIEQRLREAARRWMPDLPRASVPATDASSPKTPRP
jgi:dienelactone hydrolase